MPEVRCGAGAGGGAGVVGGGCAGFCEFGRGNGCGVCADAAVAQTQAQHGNTETPKHGTIIGAQDSGPQDLRLTTIVPRLLPRQSRLAARVHRSARRDRIAERRSGRGQSLRRRAGVAARGDRRHDHARAVGDRRRSPARQLRHRLRGRSCCSAISTRCGRSGQLAAHAAEARRRQAVWARRVRHESRHRPRDARDARADRSRRARSTAASSCCGPPTRRSAARRRAR